MNVKQLIAKLKKMPQTNTVVWCDHDNDPYDYISDQPVNYVTPITMMDENGKPTDIVVLTS